MENNFTKVGQLEKPCVDCGKVIHLNQANNQQLIESNLCARCYHWTEWFKRYKTDNNTICISGFLYQIIEDPMIQVTCPPGFTLAPNPVIYTPKIGLKEDVNLYPVGLVPSNFKDRIINNAVFVSDEDKHLFQAINSLTNENKRRKPKTE